MGRPVEHNEVTGAALLDAAEAILAEEGPDAISVRRVATEVGVTTRAVYTVFGNKDGLLAELAVRGHNMLEQLLVECGFQDDPLDDLVLLGRNGFRKFANTKPHLYRLSFERTPIAVAANPRAIAAASSVFKLLVMHFERGQQLGFLKQGEPKFFALNFHAQCMGLSNWELGLQPPPVGAGMSVKLPPEIIDKMWGQGLTALVLGFSIAPPEDSSANERA